MCKTEKGALWLNEEKTSPYDFYQYFRNVADEDTENCLKLLTFLPLEEIKELVKHTDERINLAKQKLAFEVTKLIHGEQKAKAAEEQAKAAFSGDADNMPSLELSCEKTVVDVLVAAKLAPSKGEARRLIEGGGIKIDDDKITDVNQTLTLSDFVLHKGKKVHVKITLK